MILYSRPLIPGLCSAKHASGKAQGRGIKSGHDLPAGGYGGRVIPAGRPATGYPAVTRTSSNRPATRSRRNLYLFMLAFPICIRCAIDLKAHGWVGPSF